VLLEQLLADAGVAAHEVHGPELHSHIEIGLAVAAGIADTALGLRSAANELGLGFVPITWESYDIVLGADALGAARPLIAAVADPAIRTQITHLGGYDLSDTGRLDDLTR
jgi:molybdate-binding protein